MNTSFKTFTAIVTIAMIMASCGSMRTTSEVRDDVYFMPSDAPPTANVKAEPVPAPVPAPATTSPKADDDYYNEKTSEQYQSQNSYYDMAYNDPYYYNYGRFGFNSGLAGRTGNGYGYNGALIQFGYGTGMYSGWSSAPGFGGYGYGSPYGGWGQQFYDPWYGGYPYGGYGYNGFGNNGFGYGGYGSYYGGYGGYGSYGGYGNYYSPYGNYCTGYQPVVIGGSSGTVIGHRPGIGGSGTTTYNSGTSSRSRTEFRDPIGLDKNYSGRGTSRSPAYGNGVSRDRFSNPSRGTDPSGTERSRNSGTERSVPSRNGGLERGNSSGGSFGGSGGGGTGGSGGGSRSGGGGRPR